MLRILRVTLLVAGMILVLCAEGYAQQGRAIFEGKGNCWTCHGKDGRGTVLAPDLTDGEWLNTDGSPAAIAEVIRKGVPKPKRHPGNMPAMGGARLSAAEVEAVAAYVVSLQRPAAADTTRAY